MPPRKRINWERKTISMDKADTAWLDANYPKYGLTLLIRNAIGLMKYFDMHEMEVSFTNFVERFEVMKAALAQRQAHIDKLNIRIEELRDVLVKEEKGQ